MLPPPPELDPEIFKKSDRQDKLFRKLGENFPKYDFVVKLTEYIAHINVAIRLMEDSAISVRNAETNPDKMKKAYQEINFFIFSIFSLPQAIGEFLQVEHSSLRRPGEFKKIINEWKDIPAVFFFKQIRNRIQHGEGYLGSLRFDARTVHHKDGPSWSWGFYIPEEWWEGIADSYKESQKKAPDQDKVTRDVEVLKNFYRNELSSQNNKVAIVVGLYLDSIRSMSEKIRALFRVAYRKEVGNYNNIIQECAEIENWLNSKGVTTPFFNVPELI